MDLFEYMRSTNMEKESPLAARLRPRTLDEVVGQQHIIGKDKLLYRAIQADKLSSIILYGPPGTGKTTLAKVIANTTSAEFAPVHWLSKRRFCRENQCYGCREERHGSGGGKSERNAGYVWEKDNIVY